MDRIKLLIAFLLLAVPAFADTVQKTPFTFATGSSLTIQTGVPATGLMTGTSLTDGDFAVYKTGGLLRKATGIEIFNYTDNGTTFIPYWNTTGQHQWDQLLFSDDESLGLGATTVPSQRAVKAYVDGSVTIDASAFSGNLTTSDDTIQELADAVDALTVSGSAGAPTDATYITSTSNGTLSNEFALGGLATGLLKNTTTSGIPTIAAAGTDYLAPAAIGSTVQAFDADLSLWAATTPPASYTTGDLLYASGTNTIGRITAVATGKVLASGGGGAVPQFVSNPTLTALTLSTGALLLTGDKSTTAWTTNGLKIRTASATLTDTTSSGTVSLGLTNRIAADTIAASSATTFTNYFGFFVAEPVAGTNVTLTHVYALGADSLKVGSGTTIDSSGILTAAAGAILNTPASMTATNITGTAAGLTAGNATVAATTTAITTATSSIDTTSFPLFVGANSASNQIASTDAGFTFNPVSGALVATTMTASGGFTGSLTGQANASLVVLASQPLSGAGAVNTTSSYTEFTSTGSGQALTLADGAVGQVKYITHVVDGGSGVLTPTTKQGFSTITFTVVGDSVTLIFGTNGWHIMGSYGATIAP